MSLRNLLIVALLAAVSSTGGFAPSAAPQEEPSESGLVEKSGRRLGQVDVTVRGPAEVIGTLTREDFELVIAGRFMREFSVDRLCDPGPSPAQAEDQVERAQADDSAPPTQRLRRPATYLFYFDQHHLTSAGRQNGLDSARTLVRQLIQDGNRGLIISAGRVMKTFALPTDDPDLLLEALDQLENDRNQFDDWPQTEEYRLREILDILNEDTYLAVSRARIYQKEDAWRTEKALRLFALALGHLGDLDQPKAAIYFADTMRSNAGEHYTYYFGQAHRDEANAMLNAIELDALAALNPFDRVIRQSAAMGIRLYTVQAEGLQDGDFNVVVQGRTLAASVSTSITATSGRRIADAQNSLTGFAIETGGQSFLNGVSARKIARRIIEEMSCVYLLSFDPSRFTEDNVLTVTVRVTRPGVKPSNRGIIVLSSEAKRRATRLLTAFTAPDASRTDAMMEGFVVPTGFADGKFTALVQMAVPASPLTQAEWDVGASLVTRYRVRDEVSQRISVGRPGVPVVLEAAMEFKPGPFELIMVAQESGSGLLATGQLEDSWPDPDETATSLGPIALLQPVDAAFFREESSRLRSALGVSDERFVRTELPTMLIGLVCRGPSKRTKVLVERTLVGDTSAAFPDMRVDFGDDQCIPFVDEIPPGAMGPGSFVYNVVATVHDGPGKAGGQPAVTAKAVRKFNAVDRDTLNQPAEQ